MKIPNWFAYLDIASIMLNTTAFIITFVLHKPFLVILHGLFVTISIQHLLNSFVWNRNEETKDS